MAFLAHFEKNIDAKQSILVTKSEIPEFAIRVSTPLIGFGNLPHQQQNMHTNSF